MEVNNNNNNKLSIINDISITIRQITRLQYSSMVGFILAAHENLSSFKNLILHVFVKKHLKLNKIRCASTSQNMSHEIHIMASLHVTKLQFKKFEYQTRIFWLQKVHTKQWHMTILLFCEFLTFILAETTHKNFTIRNKPVFQLYLE